ncbi:hypothetical protein N836_22555 [Leptolyngbya sp. Heron Island J]|nr:hypothetical protein N836_22555 [Leptolyngbya sp. Heron Island J]
MQFGTFFVQQLYGYKDENEPQFVQGKERKSAMFNTLNNFDYLA